MVEGSATFRARVPAASAEATAAAAASVEYSSALSLAGEHPANTIRPAEASIRALRIVILPVPW